MNVLEKIWDGSAFLTITNNYAELDLVSTGGGQEVARPISGSATVGSFFGTSHDHYKIVNLVVSNTDPDGTVAKVNFSIRSSTGTLINELFTVDVYPGNTVCLIDETRPISITGGNHRLRAYVLSGGNAGASSSDIYTYSACEEYLEAS